jgi:TP901 family phage tail tape measure protein
MAAITLDIGGDTRRLDRDIQKTVNRSYNINLKTKGDAPLGRITGKVDEFNKSLDASNARVIAFGATTGVIFGVQKAFRDLVSTTIEVQKQLKDINVLLNLSTQSLNKFGSELFNIAKNTGQAFNVVAEAAQEFSRQGLGVEETLKRTNEALILSRLSGLGAAQSVEALTAAVNSYAAQAVTATEIVNKFANVDASFAVSSKDLAEALGRVGSSAAQAGISLDELIAIVTTAQQTTARGGSVIGNSFKTIFTRLQRGKVIELLEGLGVETTNAQGQIKSAIELLKDLANVYDQLGTLEQASIAEQVGGVFQINILKAALGDLGKEYSIYNNALRVSANTTDEAIQRNEELNKTYAAQLNALQENIKQLSSTAGGRLITPVFERVVGGSNELLGGINESDGQSIGAVLGKGILDGLGQFIAGPGLAVILGLVFKIFKDVSQFAAGSFKTLLGLNTATNQQRDLQQSITQILSKNPKLLELALQGQTGLNQAANTLLGSLQKQTVELQKQSTIASQISKAFFAKGVRVKDGVPTVVPGRSGKASGYIPNFAKDDFAREELLARTLGAKNPTAQMSKGTIDGKKFIKNNREIEITNFGRNGDSAVIPTYGRGFIPNFQNDFKKFRGNTPGTLPNALGGSLKDIPKRDREKIINFRQKYGYLLPPGFSRGTLSGSPKFKIPPGIRFASPDPRKIKTISDPQENKSATDLEGLILNNVAKAVSQYTNTLQPLGKQVGEGRIKAQLQSNIIAGARGALRSITGSGFEIGITEALGYEAAIREKGGDFDVRGGRQLGQVQELFGISAPLMDFKVSLSRGNTDSFYEKIAKEERLKNTEFGPKEQKENARLLAIRQIKEKYPNDFQEKGFQQKIGNSPELKKQIEKDLSDQIKRNESRFVNLGSRRGRASGYIPNFAAIQDAVNRERDAGIPKNQIYLAQEKALKSANPMGIGVFNKRDEPTAAKRREQMRIKGFANGYVPNFATIDDPDIQASNLGSSIAALTAQLGFLAFSLTGFSSQYKSSLQELTQSNVASAKINLKNVREQARSKIDYSSPAAFRQSRQQAASEIKTARQNVKGAERGTVGQKFAAGGQAGGFALAIAAPILAETIANAIGKETAEARRTSASVSALGQIGSFAGTGAIFGPKGAAIGAAAGALLTIPQVVSEFNTVLPELSAAAKESARELQKFNEAGQKILTSSSELSKLISEGGSPKEIKSAEQAYREALLELSTVDRQRLSSAAKLGSLEEEYAKVLEEKIQKEKSGKSEVALTGVLEDIESDIRKNDFVRNQRASSVGGLASLNAGDFKTDFFDLSSDKGRARRSGLAEGFATELRGGKSPEEFLKSLSDIKIPDSIANQEDFNSFVNSLEGLPANIKTVIKNIGAQDPEAAFQVLRSQINFLRKDTRKFVTDQQALIDAQNLKNETLKNEKAAIDATISTIQKNIAVNNLLSSTLDSVGENLRGFYENLKIEQELTRPREALESIIGSDKSPTMRLAGQEGLAKIREEERSGTSAAGLDLKNSIRDILQKPFQENIDKLIEDLNKKSGGLDSAPSITAESQEVRDKAEQQRNQLNSVMKNVEGLMGQFVSRQIDTQQLLELSKEELSKVGIDINRGTQASNDIELAVAEFGAKQVNEQAKAYQQRIRLALDTKQAILQSKIEQALGVFGGFEGFMNRPDETESYIDRISPSLQTIEEMRGSPTFRYNNKASRDEQRKQAPELGRAFSNVYRELINQSGGAFRDFLQKTVDQGLQQTGVESRSGLAGASRLGGLDDIIQGVESDLTSQLKLAEDQIKVTKDPVIKRDLQGFVDSIKDLNLKDVATLQTQKEFGVARQSDFQRIYGEYENKALERLSQISPELVAALEGAIDLSDDPLISEAQLQTQLQNEIVGYLNPIQQALIYLTKNREDGDLETPDIEPYITKLSERQKERAEEIRTKQEKDTPATTPQERDLQKVNAATEVSFTQQEAAFNNNTSAITLLTAGVENLNTTIANFEANFANLNNNPGAQPAGAQAGGAQPNITTTTTAPVNLVLNAQGGNDIADAVGDAIENAIPTIINKVRAALGPPFNKVPPQAPKP